VIRVFHHTEPGGHAENEDAFAVAAHPGAPDCLLCAVADGQGGQPGGGPAARRACRAALDAASRHPASRLGRPEVWSALLREADAAVACDPDAGYTTLVALAVAPDRVCGASSGDSAAVLLGDGVRHVLTGRQHKNPPVGSGGAVFVGFAAALVGAWTILALTDGVWKYAGWQRVLDADPRRPGDAILTDLLQRARLPGSGRLQDDFTAVVFQPEPQV
jgi:hypothetical protein